jgi:hypothetical protein
MMGNTAHIDRSCMVYKHKTERNIFTQRSDQLFHSSDQIRTHKKKVWVVGKDQCRRTNSVVVTSVHVTQSETTWPASKDSVKRRVQRLQKRLQRLEANVDGELYTIRGRAAASAGSARKFPRSKEKGSCRISTEEVIANQLMYR